MFAPARWFSLAMILFVATSATDCKNSSAKSGHGSTLAVKAVVHLEPFVVNLADPEDNRFLRIGIDLGVQAAVSKEGKGEGEVPMARIRDCILGVLSMWRSDALLAPDGKQKLRQDLVRALQSRVPELAIKEVYFTDFLVQR